MFCFLVHFSKEKAVKQWKQFTANLNSSITHYCSLKVDHFSILQKAFYWSVTFECFSIIQPTNIFEIHFTFWQVKVHLPGEETLFKQPLWFSTSSYLQDDITDLIWSYFKTLEKVFPAERELFWLKSFAQTKMLITVISFGLVQVIFAINLSFPCLNILPRKRSSKAKKTVYKRNLITICLMNIIKLLNE